MISFKDQRGYTLLEVLIALFLTAIIAVAGFEFFVTMHNQRVVQEDVSDMQQNSRNSLQEIVKTLRMAGYKAGSHVPYRINSDSLYVFYSNTQPVDTVLYYLDDYSEAELSRIDEAPSGLEPRKLMRKVNGAPASIFADYIRFMLFNVVDSSTIQVSLVTQASKPDEAFSSNYGYRLYVSTELVKLRNVAL